MKKINYSDFITPGFYFTIDTNNRLKNIQLILKIHVLII